MVLSEGQRHRGGHFIKLSFQSILDQKDAGADVIVVDLPKDFASGDGPTNVETSCRQVATAIPSKELA